MRSLRIGLLLTGAVLIAVTIVVAAYYFWLPHASLRVTTGPAGSAADRFVSAFVAVTRADHPRVKIELVEVHDLATSSKALEDGKADLAIVRTDAILPSNGQTVAILRRDVVAFVLPAKSRIGKIADLNGKTVGIPKSPVQTYNEHTLDTILSYYDVPSKAVKRVILAPDEIPRAIREKEVAAIFAIGPIAPGEAVDVVGAFKSLRNGVPRILSIDEAEAIAKRFPGFESIDVPAGAFSGRPPIPSDSVTTLAVTYRFAAPALMLDIVAGLIARSIFTAKAKLMAKTPLANQIEAPDPDDKNPVLPIHPGVVAYLNSGEQSFFDEFQQFFYIGGMVLTATGSAIALIAGHLRQRKARGDLKRINRLIEISDLALVAPADELDGLEGEVNEIMSWFVKGEAGGDIDSTALSVALQHSRHMIERRRDSFRRTDGILPSADRLPYASTSKHESRDDTSVADA